MGNPHLGGLRFPHLRRAVALLSELIAFPSTVGNEGAMRVPA